MTAGRPARVGLVVVHAATALLLALPLLVGFASGELEWRIFGSAVAGVAVRAAPAAWFLLLGARVLGPITPGLVRALRWTHGLVLLGGVLVGVAGVMGMHEAARNDSPGLGQAIGMIAVAVGILIAGVALVALRLVKSLGTATGPSAVT